MNRYAVCFRQGNGTHRYLQFPPSDRHPTGYWFDGYRKAYKFAHEQEASDAIKRAVKAGFAPSGPWLGKCSMPFVTDKEEDHA